jgi:hypothetical protein
MVRGFTIPFWKCSGYEIYAFISVTPLSGYPRESTTSADTKKARTAHISPTKYLTLRFSDLPQHAQRQALGNVRALAELQG